LEARHERRKRPVSPALQKIDVQKPRHTLQREFGEGLVRNGRRRVDVEDDHHSTRIARIDTHIYDTANTHAEITHCCTALETTYSTVEINLVTIVVSML